MGNQNSEPFDFRVTGGAKVQPSNKRSRKISQPPSDVPDEEYGDDDDSDSGNHPYDDDDDDDDVQEAPGDEPPLSPEQALKCCQKRDLERPQRAMSPYNCFIKARMKGGGKGRGKAVGKTHRMKTLASQWKSMSDDDKVPYVNAAAEDRQRYDKEKAKYEKDKSQIIKRPLNGYILFMRDFRKHQKGNYKDAKELVREGAKAWKRLNNEQKKPYNEESLADSSRYARERLQSCNKVVLRRKNDTRVSKEEMGGQQNGPLKRSKSKGEMTSQQLEPSKMETTDDQKSETVDSTEEEKAGQPNEPTEMETTDDQDNADQDNADQGNDDQGNDDQDNDNQGAMTWLRNANPMPSASPSPSRRNTTSH